MTTCTTPRCQSPARWRVTGTDRVVCGDHIPDSTPVEAIPDDTILAARCPPGWRRDPGNGRPVMPCLGKLLFPCEPHEVPTATEIADDLCDARLSGIVDELVCILLINAATAKHRHGECLDLLDERVVSDVVDAALREQGTVRIRRVAGGWEEVADAAAAGAKEEASDGEN